MQSNVALIEAKLKRKEMIDNDEEVTSLFIFEPLSSSSSSLSIISFRLSLASINATFDCIIELSFVQLYSSPSVSDETADDDIAEDIFGRLCKTLFFFLWEGKYASSCSSSPC